MLKIPDQAIAAFEYFTRTRLITYVQDPLLNLAITHKIHDSANCFLAKRDSVEKCYHFDCVHFIPERWLYRNGALKLCRAGILEWIMPVMNGDRLLCILNAGIRKPPAVLPDDLPVYRAPQHGGAEFLNGLQTADETELRMVLEALRQLAARLLQWHTAMRDSAYTESDLSRADRIRCLVNQNPGMRNGMKQLAKRLNLSLSRTAHVVREETGCGFKELQLANRLNYASALLRTTDLPVAEVARNSGFATLPNFHRLFRQRFGKTPLAYRKTARRES